MSPLPVGSQSASYPEQAPAQGHLATGTAAVSQQKPLLGCEANFEIPEIDSFEALVELVRRLRAPPPRPVSEAVAKVFAIPELRDLILSFVPVRDALFNPRLFRTCRSFHERLHPRFYHTLDLVPPGRRAAFIESGNADPRFLQRVERVQVLRLGYGVNDPRTAVELADLLRLFKAHPHLLPGVQTIEVVGHGHIRPGSRAADVVSINGVLIHLLQLAGQFARVTLISLRDLPFHAPHALEALRVHPNAANLTLDIPGVHFRHQPFLDHKPAYAAIRVLAPTDPTHPDGDSGSRDCSLLAGLQGMLGWHFWSSFPPDASSPAPLCGRLELGRAFTDAVSALAVRNPTVARTWALFEYLRSPDPPEPLARLHCAGGAARAAALVRAEGAVSLPREAQEAVARLVEEVGVDEATKAVYTEITTYTREAMRPGRASAGGR